MGQYILEVEYKIKRDDPGYREIQNIIGIEALAKARIPLTDYTDILTIFDEIVIRRL